MKRLVVIDGKSVFYRGYYAMPNLTTQDGTPTGGVYAFATMALEVIKRLQPDYVCVAWDKPKTNIRSRLALYADYKANRKAAPPDFYEQVEVLRKLLDALGWPLYEADDQEADDIMGAFAKQANAKGIEACLISSDLDILQLVGPLTHIYTLKKGVSNIELFHEEYFVSKYGIQPTQFADLKALKGDSSDNIPGVAGVGEKTALELIKQFKTLDGVYQNLELVKPTLRAKLEAGKDMAYLSKKLVTLDVDAPVTLDFEKAKVRNGFSDEVIELLRKLEFKALLKKLGVADQPSAVTRGNTESGAQETLKPFDVVEFDSSKLQKDNPRIIAMNADANELWVSIGKSQVGVLPIKDITDQVAKDLANGPIIGHDIKSIFRTLLEHNIDLGCVVGHDTRIAAFMINSLQRFNALEDLSQVNLQAQNPGEITAAIYKVYLSQYEQLKDLPRIKKLAHEVDFPSICLLAKMEHRGIKLDSDYLNKMSADFDARIEAVKQKIYEQAGEEFNISSPAQLGIVLFEKLKLPKVGIKKGKTGYSTGAKELAKLRLHHPIADLITEYREYTKLKNTYIDTLPKQVDAHGRLHTTFHLDVAATGRLSSQNPNLQNIPTRSELGQAIRRAFVPEPGNVLISADYNQFELRLAAAMADDKILIEDFNSGVDIHTKTAAEAYGIDLKDVTKQQRRNAKVINFGVLYGMSPHGLSAATGTSWDEAKRFIERYFELRAPIREFLDNTIKQAEDLGYVETLFGRRRPTPDVKSSNFMVREGAMRAAANMPIQGTEADLMKMAMIKVEEALGDDGMQILQIHDSILVECPEQNADKVSRILKETMENIYKLPVKLDVDVVVGKNWGEL